MELFNGSAWPEGFVISFWNITKKISFSAESSGYANNSCERHNQKIPGFFKKIFFRFSLLIIAPLIFHCLFLLKEDIWKNILCLGALFFFVLTLATALVFLEPTLRFKSAKQWHSCEHRLINLIKWILKQGQFKDLTVENLKAMNRTCLGCEMSIHIFLTIAVLIGYIIVLVIPIEYSDLLMYGVIKYFGLTKCLLMLISFLFSASLVSILAQYFFFIAKPTKEQLEETIMVGKEFLKKYELFTL